MLKVRPNTERPSTVEVGSNTLLDFDVNDILAHLDRVLNGDYKKGLIPPLWDSAATQRILGALS